MKRFGVILSVLLAAVGLSHGSISYELVTWGSGGNTLGWASVGGGGADVTSPGTGGNPDGYLNMQFVVTGVSGPQIDAIANGGAGYTGNYTTDTALRFNYLGYPGSVASLYFDSSAGAAGSTWELTLPEGSHTWRTLTVAMREGTQFPGYDGWTDVSGSGDSFLLALSQVDRIGLIIQTTSAPGTYDFGLDNWQFYVPEPGAMSMVMTALLSIGLTFRRRLLTVFRPA
jgi:hypothetical protein